MRRLVWLLAIASCTPDDEPTLPTSDTLVSFRFGAGSTDELAGTVLVPVVLSQPSEERVTVTVEAHGNASRDDFVLETTELVFEPGETEHDVAVTITPDGVAEGDETIVLELVDPVGATTDAHEHRLTISANVLPRIGFEATYHSSREDLGTLAIPLTLSQTPVVDIVLDFVVLGPPTSDDHGFVSREIVIPARTPAGTVLISAPIYDDGLDEDTEAIDLRVNARAGAVVVANGHRESILDNDEPPSVRFTSQSVLVGEGAGATIVTAELSAPSGLAITVSFDVGAVTLSTGEYTLPASPLGFAPGETRKTIVVGVVDDNVDEPEESITLRLRYATNATLPPTPPEARVTVLDDEPPPRLDFGNGGVIGEGFSAQGAVLLSRPSAFEIRFTLAMVSGGTAASTDVSVPGTVFVVPPGVTSVPFTIGTVQDTAIEGTETAFFDVFVVNPALATDGPANWQLVILDND